MSKPKLIKGIARGTGLPIDGIELVWSLWDYDPEYYHLFNWEDKDEEAVMETTWKTEYEAGLGSGETYEEFRKIWKEGKWSPDGVFAIPIGSVEVTGVIMGRLQEQEQQEILLVEAETDEEKTVKDIIEEVAYDICMNFCKYADMADENEECQCIREGMECPLDRLF